MFDIESLIAKLRNVPNTPGVSRVLSSLINMRPAVAQAKEELLEIEKEERAENPLTPEQQELINKEALASIEVNEEELVKAVTSVKEEIKGSSDAAE